MDSVLHEQHVNKLLAVISHASDMEQLALAMDFLNLIVQRSITGKMHEAGTE